MNIEFCKKYFIFNLSSEVENSNEKIISKQGWIIKLKNEKDKYGYGEVSPIYKNELKFCENEILKIPSSITEKNLLNKIKYYHPCIQSGINNALAEMKGFFKFKKEYPFKEINQSAILLKTNSIMNDFNLIKESSFFKTKELTIKWKVGILENRIEEQTLFKILDQISSNIRLRIDANGAWNREIANRWAEILRNIDNIDWLEQPLNPDDIEGLTQLNQKMPIALDESLIKHPKLTDTWNGWQIRRPTQEKNPLKLVNELQEKKSLISISTSFETGIGRRILYHCALLQSMGSTPKVPGLGLRQIPNSLIFSNDPNRVWESL